MANRGATNTVLTEIGKSKTQPFHLFEGYWDAGTVYLSDAGKDIAWNGRTYLALGKFLDFDAIEESTDLQATGVELSLSGVPSDLLAVLVGQDFLDRQVKIYKGFWDDAHVVLADPVLIFDGRMDGATLSEDPASGTATIKVPAASHWVDFERVNGRKTNSTSQMALFPDDASFRFVPALVNKIIQWGG